MALMDTRIPMMGQGPDVMNALARGSLAAAQQNQVQTQNALADLYQTQGPGIAAGETGALNALAQLSPEMALGIQDSRQVMQHRNVQMDVMQQQMELAREQARMQAEEAARNMSAAEAAAASEELSGIIRALSMAETPEQHAALVARLGVDPGQHSFENRFVDLAMVTGTKEALDARASMGPQEPEGTATLREYNAAREQGYQGTFMEYQAEIAEAKRPQTNVTVGGAAPVPASGFQNVFDENGNLVRQEMIPYGPADLAARADAEAQERQEALTARQLNPTIDDIQTARHLAMTGIGTTGMMSGAMQRVPWLGQQAVDLNSTIDAIGSGISLENLNQMRQASPTGGALGNVSDKQSGLLAEAFGSLRQSQSQELFLYNLARIENTLNDIIHRPDGGPPRHDMSRLRVELLGGEPAPIDRILDEMPLDAPAAAEPAAAATEYTGPAPALIAQMTAAEIRDLFAQTDPGTMPQEIRDAISARLTEIQGAQ
jgi:hypothetical protein